MRSTRFSVRGSSGTHGWPVPRSSSRERAARGVAALALPLGALPRPLRIGVRRTRHERAPELERTGRALRRLPGGLLALPRGAPRTEHAPARPRVRPRGVSEAAGVSGGDVGALGRPVGRTRRHRSDSLRSMKYLRLTPAGWAWLREHGGVETNRTELL